MNEMKMSDEQTTLEDVLDAYVSANPTPNKRRLSEWIRRYPQYRRQLIDLTVSWIKMENPPLVRDTAETDEKTLVQQGMTIVQNLVNQQREQKPTVETAKNVVITGLLSEGRKLGLSIQDIAEGCRLGTAMIRKLDRCLIAHPSIPPEANARAALVIRSEPETVSYYLSGPQKFAPGARHRAELRPAVTEKQDFFAAVRDDTTMSEADKLYWLAFEPGDRED